MKGKVFIVALVWLALALSLPACEKHSPSKDREAAAPGNPEKAAEEKTRELDKAWELSGLEDPESVLYDAARDLIYVSNVNGPPTEKDGNGFITKAAPGGEVIELQWVKGMDAPKGMALNKDKLYVSDIDKLVEIDAEKGRITNKYPADKAMFLNDVAAGPGGEVYVSDMMDNAIYRLDEGGLKVWLKSPELESPNGLYVDDEKITVASWQGKSHMGETGPGHLKTVDLKDKSIKSLGSGKPVGSLDGLEPDGHGNFFVTDYQAGKLLLIKPSGKHTMLMKLSQGSADLDFVKEKGLLLIPLMNDNKVAAFRVK